MCLRSCVECTEKDRKVEEDEGEDEEKNRRNENIHEIVSSQTKRT